jgi:hypothetical protein
MNDFYVTNYENRIRRQNLRLTRQETKLLICYGIQIFVAVLIKRNRWTLLWGTNIHPTFLHNAVEFRISWTPMFGILTLLVHHLNIFPPPQSSVIYSSESGWDHEAGQPVFRTVYYAHHTELKHSVFRYVTSLREVVTWRRFLYEMRHSFNLLMYFTLLIMLFYFIKIKLILFMLFWVFYLFFLPIFSSSLNEIFHF